MDRVINLSKRTSNGIVNTPQRLLEEELERVDEQDCPPRKMIVISIDESNGNYDISWSQAGMKMSECIAACEIVKNTFLNEMGY